MGHYLSEVGHHDDYFDAKERSLLAREKCIAKMIEEKGIAKVLAEMVDDPTLFSIHSRG